MNSTRKEISMHLRILRMSKQMSQEQLAKELGIAKNTVYYWEKGQREPSYEMIEKIADLFNVSPSYLLGWDRTDNDDICIMPVLKERYVEVQTKTLEGKIGEHKYYCLGPIENSKSILSRESLQTINELVCSIIPSFVKTFAYKGTEEEYIEEIENILNSPDLYHHIHSETGKEE